MTLARCGLVVVAALLLAGCGGGSKSNPRRDAVNAYFDRVDRAEAGLIGSAGEIDRAFRNFRLAGNSAHEVNELEFARDRTATALRGVRALEPPAAARGLHADIVQLLTLQHAAAVELLQIVTYEPRFRQALAPLAGAGKALAQDIREAAKVSPPPATVSSADKAGAAVWGAAGCGACHTLAAVGATGTSGPNLDVLQLTPAQIEAQVRTGGGGMPAFGKRLTPARITALASFVAGAENRQSANDAVLGSYESAFARYHDSVQRIVDALDALEAPPVLAPTLLAEQRTLRRTAALSGSVASALHSRNVRAANKGIRDLFATAASADQVSTRKAAAAAVRAYNGRLRRIATLSARITRERQRLVQQVG